MQSILPLDKGKDCFFILQIFIQSLYLGVDKQLTMCYYGIVNKKIKSLNAQLKAGTIERNTEIRLRVLGGEPQVGLAREFHITKQMVNKIIKRYQKAKANDSIS